MFPDRQARNGGHVYAVTKAVLVVCHSLAATCLPKHLNMGGVHSTALHAFATITT
jgi:hypothetical protein